MALDATFDIQISFKMLNISLMKAQWSMSEFFYAVYGKRKRRMKKIWSKSGMGFRLPRKLKKQLKKDGFDCVQVVR